ncbi:zinc finger protein 28-like [Hetaerina americana]|uniref:zinc finger protein 28-like n=1 Tax=Hetaerina americana TaxID=62018 RepID=UPI003A7F2D1C
MREVNESDGPGESPMDIDLSIVKEEVLSIDEYNEFSWSETISQDQPVNIKQEEDEEDLGAGDEGHALATPPRKRRKGQRRTTRVVRTTKEKVKHWCSICKCKQESPRALALHRLQLHPDDARYSCAYCPRVFFHHSNHRKHQLTHLGPLPRQQCTMCTKSFARKDGLLAHIRSVHTGERPYVCNHCGMTFARDFCYRTHMYIHTGTRPYQCDECTRAFYCKSDLVRHKRLHTGEKPYGCDKCPKTFRVRGQLNQHRASHTGERPLACGLCPKTFRLGTNVALHRGGHIVNATMLKMHKCDICLKEFSRRGNLMEHRKRHAPVKSVKCRYCNLSFKTNGDWAKHENVHTREKLYVCDACGRSFMRKGRLRSHIHKFHLKPSHPKKPTKCLACGRDYIFPSKLKIHQKNKKCSEYLKKLKKKAKTA